MQTHRGDSAFQCVAVSDAAIATGDDAGNVWILEWPTRQAVATQGGRPEFDVFLCHASEDKAEVARPLKAALEAAGLTVFLDEDGIQAGESISGRINDAILRARLTGAVEIVPVLYEMEPREAASIEADVLGDLNLRLSMKDGLDRVVAALVARVRPK